MLSHHFGGKQGNTTGSCGVIIGRLIDMGMDMVLVQQHNASKWNIIVRQDESNEVLLKRVRRHPERETKEMHDDANRLNRKNCTSILCVEDEF